MFHLAVDAIKKIVHVKRMASRILCAATRSIKHPTIFARKKPDDRTSLARVLFDTPEEYFNAVRRSLVAQVNKGEAIHSAKNAVAESIKTLHDEATRKKSKVCTGTQFSEEEAELPPIFFD